MSVLDGFKEVGERTGGKLTMTVMLESVRFSKGVSEVLGRPEYVKLLVNYERGKFAIQVCDENDDFALQFNAPNADTPSSVTARNLDLLVATQKFFTFPEVPADKIAFFALDGEYHSDERVIIFDAKNGVRSGTVGKRGPKAGHGGRRRRKIDDVKEATVIGSNNAL